MQFYLYQSQDIAFVHFKCEIKIKAPTDCLQKAHRPMLLVKHSTFLELCGEEANLYMEIP